MRCNHIVNNLQHMFVLNVYKCQYLIKGISYSINEKNPFTAMLCTRSTMEFAATMNHYYKEIISVIPEGKDKVYEEDIIELDEILIKFYRGARFDFKSYIKDNKLQDLSKGTDYYQASIYNYIDELIKFDQGMADARYEYSFICEFVHPNLGTNWLLEDTTATKDSISVTVSRNISSHTFSEILTLFLPIFIKYMVVYKQSLGTFSNYTERIAASFNNPIEKERKINNQ